MCKRNIKQKNQKAMNTIKLTIGLWVFLTLFGQGRADVQFNSSQGSSMGVN